eukprot:scaffold647925_cov34-Prasinocladus_malaysianus.AAC.3
MIAIRVSEFSPAPLWDGMLSNSCYWYVRLITQGSSRIHWAAEVCYGNLINMRRSRGDRLSPVGR